VPIAEAGGFIDSFAGDEIKALFDTAPDAAVRAGIGMWHALEAFNRRSAEFGQPTLRMGVGINTGPVVLGTVGGNERLQCSVVGDPVNLASRIEQLTKLYGVRLLIGEATWRGLQQPQAFELRRIDRVAVKGKDAAVSLFEVLDAEDPPRRAAKRATLPLLQQAMELYAQREFGAARTLFERIATMDPLDALPALFIERCLRYAGLPPPQDWHGVERLTQK